MLGAEGAKELIRQPLFQLNLCISDSCRDSDQVYTRYCSPARKPSIKHPAERFNTFSCLPVLARKQPEEAEIPLKIRSKAIAKTNILKWDNGDLRISSAFF